MKGYDSKNLVRSTTDAKHLATKFIDYLRFLERDYVAILYDSDCAFSNQVFVNIRDSKGNLCRNNENIYVGISVGDVICIIL